MPEINTAMFQRIHHQITTHPESHNQSFFEMAAVSCGTTRCVAGWAVWFEAEDRPELGGGAVFEIASTYLEVEGLPAPGSPAAGGRIASEIAAAHILGLDTDAADRLFYTLDNDRAVECVEELAAGSIPAELTEEV